MGDFGAVFLPLPRRVVLLSRTVFRRLLGLQIQDDAAPVLAALLTDGLLDGRVDALVRERARQPPLKPLDHLVGLVDEVLRLWWLWYLRLRLVEDLKNLRGRGIVDLARLVVIAELGLLTNEREDFRRILQFSRRKMLVRFLGIVV